MTAPAGLVTSLLLLLSVSSVSGQLTPVIGGSTCAGHTAEVCRIPSFGLAWSGPDMLITDAEHRVWRMTPDRMMTVIAGTGIQGAAGDGGPAVNAQLAIPRDIAVVGSDTYIADTGNGRVRKISAGTITTVLSGLSSPSGLGVGGAGLYITEASGHRVRRMSVLDNSVETIAGTGTSGYTGDGGLASMARLSGPADAERYGFDLYISDQLNNRIRRVTPDGLINTYAGNGESKSLGDGGPLLSASINKPGTLTVFGNKLYIAEEAGARVRVIDLLTSTISTLIDPATLGGISRSGPSGLLISNDGSFIYLSDFRVRDVRRAPLAAPATLTPVFTFTNTAEPTETETRTRSPTQTSTASPTSTPTYSPSSSPSYTPTQTQTRTRTWTPIPPPPHTHTHTHTPAHTPTALVQGHARYFTASRPIPQTTITLNCGSLFTTTTDATGWYGFGELAGEGCSLTATRTVMGNDGSSITSLDASWASQIAVGNRTATAHEQTACDATQNGTISNLDAARISAYAVGKPPFIPSWQFIQNGYDFTGILIGDCTGSLVPAP